LSGNRNFEARIHPLVKANYLVSPPLVVAYAIRGRIDFDITREPLGADASGTPVYLSDIWPSASEIEAAVARSVTADVFAECYGDVFNGGAEWKATPVKGGLAYVWDPRSTYIQRPPFLDSELCQCPKTISQARILGMFGDFITTDHISPAGSIKADSPAGVYLSNLGVEPSDFNSYGSRRGNHEVMVRGTFANIRLRNRLSSKEGGFTRHWPEGREMTIYDAAMLYQRDDVPLVVVAGRDYGSGSSRDWAAKGTRLLGVRAVIAQSFERIHRSNLVGMGVLPLEFAPGENAETLGLDGSEILTIENLDDLKPKGHLTIRIESLTDKQNLSKTIQVLARIDTVNELRYYRAGGILPYVLSRML
jgi:aconitate hydratase